MHLAGCCGLTPVGSQALSRCLLGSTSYLQVEQGKREGRVKARELMDWHKNCERSGGNKKESKISDAITHCLPQADWCSVSSQADLAHSTLFYCWTWYCMAWDISLLGWGHLPGCIPPKILCTLQSICWEGRMRDRQSADAVQKLFSISWNINVLSVLFWLWIQSTALYKLLQRN